MRIISGTARGRSIEAPKGLDTRPTLDRVRENLFNILQSRVRGASVLDLFAGSGALALEAVSRGARMAVLCDNARQAHQAEALNVEKLQFQAQCRLLFCDWKQALSRLAEEGQAFDLVFLDPPYRMHDLREVTGALTQKQLLRPEARIIIEFEAQGDLPAVDEALELLDRRKYGIAGIGIFGQRDQGTVQTEKGADGDD